MDYIEIILKFIRISQLDRFFFKNIAFSKEDIISSHFLLGGRMLSIEVLKN